MSGKLQKAGTPLATLATAINEQHVKAEAAINDALEAALRCGELLTEAKGRLNHGAWGAWLAQNFNGAARTAQKYMRLFERRSELPNASGGAHLGISAALSALAEPSKSVGDARAKAEAKVNALLRRPGTQQTLRALASIRDGALYRETHRDWRSYLLDRWKLDAELVDAVLPAQPAAAAGS